MKSIKLKNYELVGDPDKGIAEGGAVIHHDSMKKLYRVRLSQDGALYTLVVFNNHMPREFVDNLKKNAQKPSPSPLLLWPSEIITDFEDKEINIGYLTQNIEERYKFFHFPNSLDFVSKEALLKALLNLGWAFEALFINGFCYNAFSYCVCADQETGDVLVGDIEYACSGDKSFSVMNAIGFCAPEVAAKKCKPDKSSDSFNLALLMYYMLVRFHPYGDYLRRDEATKRSRYGTDAVFVFHPDNDSNRLNPSVPSQALAWELWSVLPEYIKELFIKTFTLGVPDPLKMEADLESERRQRTSVREWRGALQKWLDSLVACPDCQRGICVDVSDPRNLVAECPYCGYEGRIYRPVLSLSMKRSGSRSIVLDAHKHISLWTEKSLKNVKDGAVVLHNSTAKGVYGLANLDSVPWKVNIPGGKSSLLEANGAIPAIDGISIDFDYEVSGTIVYEYDYADFAPANMADCVTVSIDIGSAGTECKKGTDEP